jgi:hypothetical protein
MCKSAKAYCGPCRKLKKNWHDHRKKKKCPHELSSVEAPSSRDHYSRLLMTLQERIDNYKSATDYPQGLFISEDGRIVGTWIMGQNYTVKSSYYGGYPAGYLKRIKALFPDKKNILHLFSGKVDTIIMPGKTVDINSANGADYVDDAQTLEKVPLDEFDLVCADPPYSVEDCDHYQTTMIKRNKVMSALGKGLNKGTHVVWLDQVLPMYRKDQFKIVGVIGMVKSTNHRFRVVTIFEKV